LSTQAIDGKLLKQMLLHGAAKLEALKENVNALNVFPVPDGDTGTNMSMTMASAVRELERTSDRTVEEVSAAVAQGSLMGARGNSGVILSQLFRGFAKGCEGRIILSARELADAFQLAVETAYKAVMKPVEGTILTVARESAAAGVSLAKHETDPQALLKGIVEAAELSLARTPELLPVLKKSGVVDSGGKGYTVILHGMHEILAGGVTASAPAAAPAKPAPEPTTKHDLSPATRIDFDPTALEEIKFPYDCEFFIRRYPGGKPIPHDEIARLLEPMGDSIYVVGSEDRAKVHIHSDNPGPVFSLCIQYGDLIDIVIHNMREQHDYLLEHAERTNAEAPAEQPEGPVGLSSVVAVAAGEGLAAIFESLGAAHVIQGGQTMNPSTEDLLNAINSCPAEAVFVLPNNKNIILAAQQAAALTQKKVYVIPTRSVPQGIAAMVSWMADAEPAKLESTMTKAAGSVQTGEVTYAVRTTTFGDLQINEGDILGLANGQIKLTGHSPEATALELIGAIKDEFGGEILSLYWGEGADEAKAQALAEQIQAAHPDLEIDLQYGGQPLYFYLFGLE
jgi:DAK2 domain fusion protein YloV